MALHSSTLARWQAAGLGVALLLGACSGRHEAAPAATEAQGGAPKVAGVAMRQMADGAEPGRAADAPATPAMLAYEHTLTLGTAPERVAPAHEAVLAACRAVPQNGCTVLDARLSSGTTPGASIRLRLRPEAVAALVAAASAQAELLEKTTTVEDLAAPMADTQKRVALLTSYRTQLEGLRARAGQDVDTAMKVAKELAQVQNELEGVASDLAHLTRRVQTEVLTLNLQSRSGPALWGPIGEALSDFALHLARALAGVITFVAYALPWGGVLGGLGWVGRWVWRRWRQVRPPAGGA